MLRTAGGVDRQLYESSKEREREREEREREKGEKGEKKETLWVVFDPLPAS